MLKLDKTLTPKHAPGKKFHTKTFEKCLYSAVGMAALTLLACLLSLFMGEKGEKLEKTVIFGLCLTLVALLCAFLERKPTCTLDGERIYFFESSVEKKFGKNMVYEITGDMSGSVPYTDIQKVLSVKDANEGREELGLYTFFGDYVLFGEDYTVVLKGTKALKKALDEKCRSAIRIAPAEEGSEEASFELPAKGSFGEALAAFLAEKYSELVPEGWRLSLCNYDIDLEMLDIEFSKEETAHAEEETEADAIDFCLDKETIQVFTTYADEAKEAENEEEDPIPLSNFETFDALFAYMKERTRAFSEGA